MSWLLPPHLVGAPMPNMGKQWDINPSNPNGPISSATVNVYLKVVAAAEKTAETLTHEADQLGAQASQSHQGYDAAFAKIGAATSAWRDVQRLADKLLAADDQQSTPEKTADMHQAKIAAPGIIQTAHAALMHLVGLHQTLKADQAAKRPDLPDQADLDPYAPSGLGWGSLAILGGIVYLVWKAVF